VVDERAWQGRADVTVVVPAGGTSSRFGEDKLAVRRGGVTLLDQVLAGLPPAWPVVLVGPPRPTQREAVVWVLEDPPLGGPLAAVAAGARAVATELLVVLAGDMPHGVLALPALLAAVDGGGVGAVAVDDDGRPNPLLGVYRTAALLAHLPDDPGGRPARHLLGLSPREVRVPGRPGRDVDTPQDLGAPDGGW
jgi:molybdenum cofactor guanylyltransferase